MLDLPGVGQVKACLPKDADTIFVPEVPGWGAASEGLQSGTPTGNKCTYPLPVPMLKDLKA
jgi:hypothetical protein